jgi:TrbC/VIRB2 pilin
MKKFLQQTALPALRKLQWSPRSLRIRPLDLLLWLSFAAYANVAYAQTSSTGAGGQLVSGICKMTTFVSGTLVYPIIGLAIAGFGILYMLNEMRETAMAHALRIGVGGAIVISAATLVGSFFGQSVC